MSQSSATPADQVVGILTMLSNACCCAFGLAGGALAGMFGAALASSASSSSDAVGGAVIGGILGGLGLAIAAVSAVAMFGGWGVFRGRRWGFMLTAILSGISFLLNGGSLFAGNFTAVVSVLLNIALLVYCIVRLSGSSGPAPN